MEELPDLSPPEIRHYSRHLILPEVGTLGQKKLKAAKGEERQKLFREWANARLRAEKADGMMILVCLDPRYVSVEIEDAAKGKFPEKYAQKVADALLKGLREKKPDEGLAEAVRLLREGYQGAKK